MQASLPRTSLRWLQGGLTLDVVSHSSECWLASRSPWCTASSITSATSVQSAGVRPASLQVRRACLRRALEQLWSPLACFGLRGRTVRAYTVSPASPGARLLVFDSSSFGLDIMNYLMESYTIYTSLTVAIAVFSRSLRVAQKRSYDPQARQVCR